VLARGRHGADDRTLEAGVERDLVPSALLHRLDDVAERHGITLYTALLAAFGMVLATVSGRLDLVVATPLSNRTLRGTPGMLGPAMNVVPLRLMLGGCHAIADVLAQARQVVLGAFEHHDAPYESVPPEPGAGVGGHPASPLRVLFNYFGHKAAGLQFAAVAAQRLPRDSRSSRFDLTLAARRADQALHLSVVYRQALFERDRVRALLAAYRATLARIAEDPKAPWLV
jgi:gramicidin S synthase 2/tyrocidine synthetase-3